MTARNNDGRGQHGGRGSDDSRSTEKGTPIRDNSKKSDNTVSFDRPTPQKPDKK